MATPGISVGQRVRRAENALNRLSPEKHRSEEVEALGGAADSTEHLKRLGCEVPPGSKRLARRNDKGNGRTDETLQTPRRRYGVQAQKREEPEGVQGVGQLLELVYEPIFKDFSYGFRPGRNCHQAIRRVIVIDEVQYAQRVDVPIRDD